MNIWDYEGRGWLVIPTNMVVDKRGQAVMGAGLALQAKKKYPEFPAHVGFWIDTEGVGMVWYNPNVPRDEATYGLLSFPTKTDWRKPADLELISEYAEYLSENIRPNDMPYYIPRIGTGLGGLEWNDVKAILERDLGGFIAAGKVVLLEP